MVYLVLAIFILLMLYSWKKFWGVSTYLIGVYALSVIMSIRLLSVDYQYSNTEISVIGSMVFVVLLLLYFFPYMRKTPNIVYNLNDQQIKRFTTIGYSLSLLVIFGMILMATKIREVMSLDYLYVRSTMYMEGSDAIVSNYTRIEQIGSIILGYFSGLSYVFLIMFFYAVAFIPRKILFKILLLIASFSASYKGLMVAGRTKIMYWMMFAVLCIIIFYPLMTAKTKRITRISSIIVSVPVVVYFFAVTLARTLYSNSETTDFLVSYMGQSFLNFNTFWIKYEPPTITLDRVFPLTSFLLGSGFQLDDYRAMIESKTGMNIGIFYTMLGDFMVDIGKVGMIIYSFVYCIFSRTVLKKKSYTIADLLIFAIVIQIPLHGLFYYSFYQAPSTFCALITIMMASYIQSGKLFSFKR